jgi:hypothetical protein
MMQNKKQLKKLHRQYTLLWCLKVGDALGTLSMSTISSQLDVKPVVFQRWLSGVQMAPEAIINLIKTRAFAPYRMNRRKKVLRAYPCDDAYEPDLIETKYLWKLMLSPEKDFAAQ